ncbi:MAG: PQQ-binding-like beta-propeller repeat protein [Verrucomicrobiales bacterium]
MKLTFIALALTVSSLAAADWPQFLGPGRNGIAPGEKIRSSFDPEPTIAWSHKLGDGLAGPSVASGKCVIFHRVGDLATVDALDAKTGEPLWKFTYPTGYRDDFGFDPGPRTAPTIAGGHVYTYGAEGMLHCLSLDDGTKVWSLDTTETPGSAKGFFGRASAPLVHDDTLIIQLDGIVGIDAKTGKVKWTATDHEAGYASPTLASISGETYSLHLTREGFVCLNPSTGKVLIEAPFRAKMHASVNAATPLLIGTDSVFLTACYDVGAALWELDPAGGTKHKTWERGGVLDAHYATPVLVGGKLYGFHGRQETGQELRCIDPLDGRVHWSEKIATGSVIAAGEQLVILTEKGELILAAADPGAFTPGGRGQILGASARAIPALSGGRLYARDGKRLVCVDLNQ